MKGACVGMGGGHLDQIQLPFTASEPDAAPHDPWGTRSRPSPLTKHLHICLNSAMIQVLLHVLSSAPDGLVLQHHSLPKLNWFNIRSVYHLDWPYRSMPFHYPLAFSAFRWDKTPHHWEVRASTAALEVYVPPEFLHLILLKCACVCADACPLVWECCVRMLTLSW